MIQNCGELKNFVSLKKVGLTLTKIAPNQIAKRTYFETKIGNDFT